MSMNRTHPIDGELLRIKEEIEKHAVNFGLDFYPVIFEMCDYDTINILASLGGFPNRYPHWRFGMDYDQMYKGYAYGMQKIYEMVINTSPCYAYLLNVNNMVDQKIVMAHVFGHADFFKNNAWFVNTNKNMMDIMANHGSKIRRYMDTYGQDRVETFIDRVLSLDNLLDVNVLFEQNDKVKIEEPKNQIDTGEKYGPSKALEAFMRSQKRRDDAEQKVDPESEEYEAPDFKELPTRDLMRFMMNHAPIEEWESDIIGILREEAYYFLPQRMTKIMNEGWASYWHSTIMTQKVLKASEIVDFADHHAGVMAMSKKSINPYKVGIELFRDIEYRWNTGRFGKEYNECQDINQKENWDTKANLGRAKIFEVRKHYNDITFIDEFFTQEFCERQKLFTYTYNPRTGRHEIATRDFEAIKQNLLSALTNYGTPLIEIENGNYKNRGELLLRHRFMGSTIDLNQAGETLKNLYALWKRPVNIVTVVEEKETVYCFDGKEFKAVE